jgi:hypothetical protein
MESKTPKVARVIIDGTSSGAADKLEVDYILVGQLKRDEGINL